MFFGLFGTVDNYAKMLNKIGLATFMFSLAAVIMLRSRWPWFESTLSLLPKDEVEIFSLKFHLGTIIPAALFAIAARVIKLHDVVSTLLEIRKQFEIEEILFPLALGSASPLSMLKIHKVTEQRGRLMAEVFYKYASSKAKEPQIDRHLIEMALDQWCWYWILIEANVVILISSVILIVAGHYRAASAGLCLFVLIIGSLQPLRKKCALYAREEVGAILGDVKRRTEIAEVFNGL